MSGSAILGAGSRVRGARWQVQLGVAVILGASGAFMLLDQGRAELFSGLVAGGFFLVEGIAYLVGRFGSRESAPGGEVDALRAGVGLLTAALLFGLSFLQAITLAGVRLILAIGGIPFGLLGLWLFVVTRKAGLRWGALAANLLVTAYGALLVYTQFVDEMAFGSVVAVVAGALLVIAVVLAAVALFRARSPSRPTGPLPAVD